MRIRLVAMLALLLTVLPASAQDLRLDDFLEVVGQVRAVASVPLENAVVIAFSLSDTLNLRTSSGRSGNFVLPPLPVGVYRVIAVKRGYVPAFATVTPVKKDHTIVLELEEQRESTPEQKKDAWAIRRSLPKDVLRQVEAILGETGLASEEPKTGALFAGKMESLAGYSGTTAERELERTSVALASDVGDWDLEFQGSRQLVDQPRIDSVNPDPAEAADVRLVLRSAPGSSYRISSTRAIWVRPSAEGEQTGIETHSVAWQGGRSAVQLRYQSQRNVFPTAGIDDSLEVSGNTMLYRGSRSDLGVSLSLRQDNLPGQAEDAAIRYADVATGGHYLVAEGLGIEYGLSTRVGRDRLEMTPHTAAEVRVGNRACIQLSGAYKFATSPELEQVAPGVTYLGRLPTTDTLYRYSVTVTGDVGDNAGISATARRSAADTLTFLLFDDRFDEFWDGLYLERGEALTDAVLSIRAGLGPTLQVSIVTSAGWVDAADSTAATKDYVSGEIRTHYEPTGTTLDVAYRSLRQPDTLDDGVLRNIERLSVVLGQSLRLPVDLKLLVGFSRADEVTLVAQSTEHTRPQTRLMGGVSFSF